MAEGFLLDTNICIYALHGSSEVLRAHMEARSVGSLFVSSISLAEFAVGYGDKIFDAPEVIQLLRVVELLPFEQRAAQIYGTLPFLRARFDRRPGEHDFVPKGRAAHRTRPASLQHALRDPVRRALGPRARPGGGAGVGTTVAPSGV